MDRNLNPTYRVSEVFRSIEGEALFAGVPTTFVRFFGCNLRCPGFGAKGKDIPIVYEPGVKQSVGCDSAYSWHPAYKHLAMDLTYEELLEKIVALPANNLSFTGGEPLLWSQVITKLLSDKRLRGRFDQCLIETNGTLEFPMRWHTYGHPVLPVTFSVSPKLSNSGEDRSKTIRPETLSTFNSNFYLKFVSDGSEKSFEEIICTVVEYAEYFAYSVHDFCRKFPVYVMPEGAETIIEHPVYADIAEFCIQNRFIFCTRVHSIVYGNKAGT